MTKPMKADSLPDPIPQAVKELIGAMEDAKALLADDTSKAISAARQAAIVALNVLGMIFANTIDLLPLVDSFNRFAGFHDPDEDATTEVVFIPTDGTRAREEQVVMTPAEALVEIEDVVWLGFSEFRNCLGDCDHPCDDCGPIQQALSVLRALIEASQEQP